MFLDVEPKSRRERSTSWDISGGREDNVTIAAIKTRVSKLEAMDAKLMSLKDRSRHTPLATLPDFGSIEKRDEG